MQPVSKSVATDAVKILRFSCNEYIPRVIQKLEFGKAGAQNLSQAIAGVEAAPVANTGAMQTGSKSGMPAQPKPTFESRGV